MSPVSEVHSSLPAPVPSIEEHITAPQMTERDEKALMVVNSEAFPKECLTTEPVALVSTRRSTRTAPSNVDCNSDSANVEAERESGVQSILTGYRPKRSTKRRKVNLNQTQVPVFEYLPLKLKTKRPGEATESVGQKQQQQQPMIQIPAFFVNQLQEASPSNNDHETRTNNKSSKIQTKTTRQSMQSTIAIESPTSVATSTSSSSISNTQNLLNIDNTFLQSSQLLTALMPPAVVGQSTMPSANAEKDTESASAAIKSEESSTSNDLVKRSIRRSTRLVTVQRPRRASTPLPVTNSRESVVEPSGSSVINQQVHIRDMTLKKHSHIPDTASDSVDPADQNEPSHTVTVCRRTMAPPNIMRPINGGKHSASHIHVNCDLINYVKIMELETYLPGNITIKLNHYSQLITIDGASCKHLLNLNQIEWTALQHLLDHVQYSSFKAWTEEPSDKSIVHRCLYHLWKTASPFNGGLIEHKRDGSTFIPANMVSLPIQSQVDLRTVIDPYVLEQMRKNSLWKP